MTKSAFIAITGRPNAGKSSLMNLLVGEKVAIVSEKPQTTRTRINGILTEGDTQYVFIDTPGIHRPRTRLSEEMVKSVKNSMEDVDVVIMMTDATKKLSNTEKELIESFKSRKLSVILLINKVDLVRDKSELLSVIDGFSKLHDFSEVIPISVKNCINTELILPAVDKFSKESPHFFPDDLPTDQPEKIWLAEIVREKILRTMWEEIPHGVAVQIESLDETKTNRGEDIVDLGVVIICEKASHKGMLIGKQGAMLKKIGSIARVDLEEYFESKVNMKLWVKVKDDWRNKEAFILEMGLGADD
ncbi:MAG: GTPase Era [Ruminiclostridium sp.]|nr:GTPase Era [Ruminiclostridium sp.]